MRPAFTWNMAGQTPPSHTQPRFFPPFFILPGLCPRGKAGTAGGEIDHHRAEGQVKAGKLRAPGEPGEGPWPTGGELGHFRGGEFGGWEAQ